MKKNTAARGAAATVYIIIIIGIFIFLIICRKCHTIYCENKRRAVPVKERLYIMEELYKYITTIAEENNIKLFLLFGTLLGQQRNNKLICYDYDVDFGILKPDRSLLIKALKNRIKSDGIECPYSLEIINNSFATKIGLIHKKTTINVDVDIYKETNDGSFVRDFPYLFFLYNKFISNQCKKRNIPRDWILPLKPVSFLGKNVFIPNNPGKLLACEYGKKYMTPNHTCNQDCSKCIRV
jgi:phosphorylcholine metabolism protein LicD